MSYEEIDPTQEIYFLVSGGRDSTAMVLLAYEQGIRGTLLFGDTRLNISTARHVVARLQSYTAYPLITARYDGIETPIAVLKDSFKEIPRCLNHLKKTKTFRRNMFRCCATLKHKPMETLQKDLALMQGEDITFVMGIKNEQPAHRLFRMKELREKNTRYRRMTKNNLRYYYPLRDMKENDINEILSRHSYKGRGFIKIKSSGCSICPIFCIFENWRTKDPDTWRRSVRMADRLGIKHPAMDQQFLSECEE